MKTAFITGANRGLGFGFVEYLLSEGYVVFGGTRKFDRELPQRENLIWIECDVTDDKSIEQAVMQVQARTDMLTLLINNAGTNKDTIPEGDKDLVSKLGYLDRRALLGMFNINSVSPMMMTQKFLPLLKTNDSFIINISSRRAAFSDGHGGSTANYGYCASKVALNMLTFCSEIELPKNVRTFSVHPGGVRTDMNPDGAALPFERAKDIIALMNDWKDEYNGRFLTYEGGLHSL